MFSCDYLGYFLRPVSTYNLIMIRRTVYCCLFKRCTAIDCGACRIDVSQDNLTTSFHSESCSISCPEHAILQGIRDLMVLKYGWKKHQERHTVEYVQYSTRLFLFGHFNENWNFFVENKFKNYRKVRNISTIFNEKISRNFIEIIH